MKQRTKAEIEDILLEKKRKEAKISDKQRVLQHYKRRQNQNPEATPEIISKKIEQLENEIDTLALTPDISFYELLAHEGLEEKHELSLLLYYGENLSYRNTALEILKQRRINPSHETIRKWISEAVSILSK